MDASIEKRPRTRLSPQKRKLQLMEIALEVFAKRGIGRGGHADDCASLRCNSVQLLPNS
ncbi:HTH-type transcriptional regulator LuxR [Vibrio cholerae]|nr:HTH-type transcriptional regulator LuxR [Vibrio cholerae]